MTELLKNDAEWNWSEEVEQSFQALKRMITSAPVLRSPDQSKPFVVTTDASGFAIGAELSQEFEGKLQPIAFMSKKLSPAERNYPVHEQELLAVIQAIREWKCYLDGRKFKVNTDHKSLIYLQKQPHLSSRQTRWVEFLAQFDFEMQYKSGKLNTVADALSRRSDHNDSLTEMNVVSKTIDSSLTGQLAVAQASDEFCQRVLESKLSVSEVKGGLSVRDGVVYKDQRVVVPANVPLKTRILQSYHDHPLAGHVGSEKTTELVKRDFYWPKMDEEIKLYVTTCHSCQKNKPSHQLPVGLLKPLEIPNRQWSHVSMDFIGPLPKSNGYNAIAVVVDKLTKLVHLIATTTTVTAKEVALLFYDNVVRLHGVPEAIITDRDTRFTSLLWKELMKLMSIQQRMSSAFHPQSDGQTERTNRTLETMLRHYVNGRNNDWAIHLTAAEIAINNCQQSSTKYSPFYMNYGFNPRFPFLTQSTINAPVSSTVPAAEEIVKTIQLTTQQAIQNLHKAQQQQSQYANRKRREDEFKVGEQVYLSTEKLNITSGVSKLNPKFIGPFSISKVINPVAVQLQLPPHFKIHNSFHVSRIKRVKTTDRFPNRPTLEKPPPVIQADNDKESEWEIEKIVEKRRNRGRVEYLVKWKGYDSHDNQWLTVSRLANARDAIREFEESLTSARLNAISSDRVGSSVQCSGQTKAGRRCRKRTLRSGLCQIHLNRDHNLRIKQSTIQGAKLGLFSGDRQTKRNEIVTPYTGQFSATKTGGNYVLQLNKHHFINANRHIDTGGFANECRHTNRREKQCKGNNSRFTVNQPKKQVWIKTTRTIPPDTEVFVPYGADYWKKFNKQKLKQE
jgi:RNase H-like domain found in reverse transcriptase/Integrase zinc binding domain/Chromo (CHRromatin Organisation MOdifier) domain